MYDPKFLFVRYCPGSCGNFLISMLQTSSKISHWYKDIENSKPTDFYKKIYFEWFKNRFQSDLTYHLKSEPHHPYCLDFVSAKHPRGDELTLSEFLRNIVARNDKIFLNAVKEEKIILLRLNKVVVPRWAENSIIINIFVDPPGYKWLHRIRAIKLFGFENQKFISKENHPDYLKYKYKKILFNNQYKFDMSQMAFLRDHVIGEKTLKIFKSKQSILDDPSNSRARQQIFVNLSDFFQWQYFEKIIIDLFDQLNLGDVKTDIIYQCWNHYYQTNINPILSKTL